MELNRTARMGRPYAFGEPRRPAASLRQQAGLSASGEETQTTSQVQEAYLLGLQLSVSNTNDYPSRQALPLPRGRTQHQAQPVRSGQRF